MFISNFLQIKTIHSLYLYGKIFKTLTPKTLHCVQLNPVRFRFLYQSETKIVSVNDFKITRVLRMCV